ncbi:MAG: hypothetical protein ACPGYJ_05780, partial [bacterium]
MKTVRAGHRDLLITMHRCIGATIGALDGMVEHSAVGKALGSSEFRTDQHFFIGDALHSMIR